MVDMVTACPMGVQHPWQGCCERLEGTGLWVSGYLGVEW